MRKFRQTVYSFYRAHGRDLPWRRTSDTYCIYVSEVMLQQTQVPRVCEKYVEFVARFPDWKSLAESSLSDVLAAWQGLGYNRRGKFLQKAAQVVVSEFGGVLPGDPACLERLPGIGPATAASIAAFAFNRPTVFIETNIRSVIIHHFFEGLVDVDDMQLRPIIEQTLDRKNPSKWYSALMDYGTELKKQIGNPSRRSRHHARQSAFEGSDRQVRGRILRTLLTGTALTSVQLAKAVAQPQERARAIAQKMLEEGILTVVRGRFRIAD